MTNLVKVAFKRETAIPMAALVLASTASAGLVIARILWTGRLSYTFLLWNLFLAWVPLVFALFAIDHYKRRPGSRWIFLGYAGAWLLFFPNAPYICTDLIHLTNRSYPNFWVEMVLILSCAVTGLVVGFVSLFLMHSMVARRMGPVASWFFVGAIAALSSFGVYLGRFLRFNSWDVVVRPWELLRGIGGWAADPLAQSNSFAFPILFAVFLFVSYLLFYAMTHLQHLPADPGSEPEPVRTT